MINFETALIIADKFNKNNIKKAKNGIMILTKIEGMTLSKRCQVNIL
ncbi:hypothetical protein LACFE_CDS1044 [Limosilactobacillus fermentum]|uniref:Uncharacterized protein n=1 Tax=Limosilactobacillus fermentum TaxID=1613 RepID=A0A1D7ZXB3_LIMFE|nr:hypothetical protein LACFE_CDS1044 [Limosilactobacillus fermentum]